MSKVLALQHIPCETLGTIGDCLKSSGIVVEYIHTFKGQSIPRELGDFTGLIVMGGPMGVYDHHRYSFLLEEMRLIEHALKEDKPVFGVCLGSQLLAASLGTEVRKGKKKEIGWLGVKLTDAAAQDPLWKGVESPFIAYHWHGDIFELPNGAVSLASSELTACQAFRYGNSVYGFLFHMEVTQGIIQEMVESFRDELQEEKIDGASILLRAKENLPPLQLIGKKVFQRWAKLLERNTPPT